MKSRSAQSFLSGRRSRIAVFILSLVAATAMMGASVQFLRLLDSERDMDAIIREDAIWAVFQADRHMRELDRLVRLVSDTGRLDIHEDLVLNYDILYSRIALLERGTFQLDLAREGDLTRKARELTSFVFDLADQIDALDPTHPNYWPSIQQLAADTAGFPALTNDLLLNANSAMNAQRVSDRDARAAIQEQLAAMLVVLILAFVGIFSLLMLQLRQLAMSSRKMALLQERSNRRAIRAQAANRAKSAFLATMSHEMRTPLNGIIGNAELVVYDDPSGPHEQRLSKVLASAEVLRDLIDGILDFSRMEKGTIRVEPAPVPLMDVANALALAYGDAARQKGISLVVDMPDEVVVLDESLLRQALAKLIENALKFSADGAVNVTATLPATGLLRVEVVDQGIGIAAEDMPRLFNGFNQLDWSRSRSFGGSGLGLALCKRIVEGQGGTIGVESVEGEGSCFWIEIPAERAEIADSPVVPDASPTASRPLHVLIAEDNPINADVLSAHLQHLGHSCTVVVNGREAVDFLMERHADLVLMDMQMPVMDGLEATRTLRDLGCALPVIGVTANAFAQDRSDCFAAGMTDFMPKPVTRKALSAMLSALEFDHGSEMLAEQSRVQQMSTPVEKQEHTDTISAQFRDLVDMLGEETAISFLDRFDDDIAELQSNLSKAVDRENQELQDNLLHTFKGAALTLGLTSSGHFAQELRSVLPVSHDQIRELIRLARQDVSVCRASVKGVARAEQE